MSEGLGVWFVFLCEFLVCLGSVGFEVVFHVVFYVLVYFVFGVMWGVVFLD